MLTETISGKCPICSYNKLRQRYGSSGYYLMDGCPSCGFGYGDSDMSEENTGVCIESWLCISIVDLAYKFSEYIKESLDSDPKYINDNCYDSIFGFAKAELEKLSQDELRYLVYESHESEERSDDVLNTIFLYGQEDLAEYIIKNNPIIFNSNGQQHNNNKNNLREKAKNQKDIMCESIRRSWDWEECPTGAGLRSTKNLGCGRNDVNGNSEAPCL